MTKRCGRKRPKQFDPYLSAVIENDLTYNFYYSALAQIALSMFEWENLPSSMNSEWLEYCLFSNGAAALLYDPEIGYVNTNAVIRGNLNLYGRPTSIECYSYDYRKVRKVYTGLDTAGPKEYEAIYVENRIQLQGNTIPTMPHLQMFAMRLAECLRSEDVNIKAQKTPRIILADEKQRFSVQNAYEQVDGNTPVLIGDKNNSIFDNFKVLDSEAPFIADKLQLYRRKIFQEALEWLGVNCIVDEKKERLVTGETDANNEVVNLNLQAFLVPRQRACRYFNDKYGLTGTSEAISVKVRSDLYNIIKTNESVVSEFISNPGSDNE